MSAKQSNPGRRSSSRQLKLGGDTIGQPAALAYTRIHIVRYDMVLSCACGRPQLGLFRSPTTL
eukprot:scaffold9887_cov143-Skeletonema_dohrnii-CCMP3373.AAC.1